MIIITVAGGWCYAGLTGWGHCPSWVWRLAATGRHWALRGQRWVNNEKRWALGCGHYPLSALYRPCTGVLCAVLWDHCPPEVTGGSFDTNNDYIQLSSSHYYLKVISSSTIKHSCLILTQHYIIILLAIVVSCWEWLFTWFEGFFCVVVSILITTISYKENVTINHEFLWYTIALAIVSLTVITIGWI